MLLPAPLTDRSTRKDAVRWTRAAVSSVGVAFHPDTRAADYVVRETGQALFAPEQAVGFDASMDRAFDLLDSSIYDHGLRAQHRLFTASQRAARPGSAASKKAP